MVNEATLSFGEFLRDIRGVIASPRQRFSVIHERGALWGSIFLLLAPSYFGFAFLGGIYFDRDPFPGYSFLVPLLAVAAVSFLKAFFIHVVARFFEGNGRYMAGTGRFYDLLTVIGYAGLPSVLALIMAFSVFLFLPGQMGYMFNNFHAAAVSVFIAVGIALFIWNLILMVLALRPIYPMRDLKIVVTFIIGSLLMAGPAMSFRLLARPVEVDGVYVAPILNERMMRAFAADPASEDSVSRKIDLHIDLIVYKYRTPKRFDYVFFNPVQELPSREGGKSKGSIKSEKSGGSGRKHKEYALGRLLGLPGERVELNQGKLLINGEIWSEPYIETEFRSNSSFPAHSLGQSEYLVLPADRRLLDAGFHDVILSRDRILGRMINARFPLGWWFFRLGALDQGSPEGKPTQP